MKIDIKEFKGTNIAEVTAEGIIINKTQDALDIMADCGYQGSNKIILHEKNIIPEFFDLKTGVAGDILQKFSNYRVQLAIVGNFAKYTSKSLRDFIFESNKTGRVCFVENINEALEKLGNKI